MKSQQYINDCKNEIDEFTKLRPKQAIEALRELEEYAYERRMDVEQRLIAESVRRAVAGQRGRRRRQRASRTVRP